MVGNLVLSESDAGVVYDSRANLLLYRSDGNGVHGDEEPISGIVILESVRLTLPHRNSGADSLLAIQISLTYDIVLRSA